MKTAMQQAIKYLKSFNLEASAIILEDKFLEKEKEQIVDAYNHNMTGFDKLEQEEIGLNWAEDYYNQTYNQS
jgi:hypothetical protein